MKFVLSTALKRRPCFHPVVIDLVAISCKNSGCSTSPCHFHSEGGGAGWHVSPKQFTTALLLMRKSLDKDENGTLVDGTFLSKLCFADDIVLFPTSTAEAHATIAELNEAGSKIQLRRHSSRRTSSAREDSTGRLSTCWEVALRIPWTFDAH